MDPITSAWAQYGPAGLAIATLLVAVGVLYRSNQTATAHYIATYIELLRLQLKISEDQTQAVEALTANLQARSAVEAAMRSEMEPARRTRRT